MEKGQPHPHPHPHRRSRARTISTHSSSSSSTLLSNKFQTNPMRNATNSNPNPINNHDYSKRNTQQLQEEGEEDLLLSSTSIVGTCPFMCPVEERVQRERLRDLSVFERLNGSPVKTSPSLAVKKFCRTISTKNVQASDVRPLPVLEDTLNYLLNLLDTKEHPFEVVHDFIFDRTRSIRQDLSMQNIINNRVIQMFEKMVKFHVISHHKLRRCSDSPNISSKYYLNMEQLTKALTSLYHLYEANRNIQSIYENEAEFRSLYVLLHLGCDNKPMGESLSFWFCHVASPIIKSKEMCFARIVLRYYRFGNYKRFICTTAAEASYLQYCIIEPYINEIRVLAVSCVNFGGYKLHPYPLADLSKLLMMKESDVESFCHYCGLETSTDEVGNKFLPTKQTSFCHPKGGFQNYCLVGSALF
ncbi:SAC3 family protein C [Camellia lanceoleosa]|uniref:SAC3 family protein C n=1 Tax=Camellia lanceoleosa TaxID=1840588 RepID=A0ACC0IQI0_9ERIC|nr:SAC3 family protein C [Camellia lanceoleosa]